ncbi:MAG: hypothetical protein WC341_11875 [Bacteroidales bacterium]|jgi:hypothetical protein
MKKIYLLMILAFVFKGAVAQFSMTSQSEANQIKNATLIVAFEEPNAKTVAKLEKKDKKKLKHYLSQIEGRNFALSNAVENYWNFTANMEYMTESEAFQLMKSNKDKYVILKFGKFLDYERVKTGLGANGKPAGWTQDNSGILTYNTSTHRSELANTITTIEIGDPKSLIKVYLPNLYPSAADAVYGIQELQYILNYLIADPDHKIPKIMRHIRDNAGALKDLTLLVDKDMVDEKLSLTEIEEIYPYPFKLVDYEEIEKAILEKDPRYAYVTIVQTPGGKGNVSTQTIMTAATGELLCFNTPKVAVTIKGTSIVTYNKRISKKQFAIYANDVEED